MKNIRKILSLVLVSAMILSITVLSISALKPGDIPVKVYVDGTLTMRGTTFIRNGVTYIPLREFSNTLGASNVLWDDASETAKVKTSKLDLTAQIGINYIVANGRYLASSAKTILEDGRTYVPVRTAAKAFGAEIEWNEVSNSVYVKKGSGTILSGDKFYNQTDLYWLSRLVSAEARGESLDGQIAVANVVLNRKREEGYPNTVYNVIFDNKYAVQFSPTASGTIYKAPAEISIIAAKIALDGYSVSENIFYFLNERLATSTWVTRARGFVMTIGSHDFYS